MEPKKVAEAPFNDTNADFILISSDGVIFYVHRVLLTLVSIPFETMFSLSRDESQEKLIDGRPYVTLEDESRKLHLLLSWCDPRCTRRSTDLDDLQSVLELADKYSMEHVIVHVENAMLGMKDLIASDPVRIFCVAARFRLRLVAPVAALESLKVPIVEWTVIPEMDYIPASSIVQLLQYHKTCLDEVRKLAKPTTIWGSYMLVPHHLQSCSTSSCNVSADGYKYRSWYVDYVIRAAVELEKRPSAATLDSTFLQKSMQIIQGLSCERCRSSSPSHLFAVQQYLNKEIEQKISQVKLSFNFDFLDTPEGRI